MTSSLRHKHNRNNNNNNENHPLRRYMIIGMFLTMIILLWYLRQQTISTTSPASTISAATVTTTTTTNTIDDNNNHMTSKSNHNHDDDVSNNTNNHNIVSSTFKDDVLLWAASVIRQEDPATIAPKPPPRNKMVDPQSRQEFLQKVQQQQQQQLEEVNPSSSQQQSQHPKHHPHHHTKCTKESPIYNTTYGKPIWMPGYPGSGYHILEHLIPRITGYNALVVYYQHTCDEVTVQYTTPTDRIRMDHDSSSSSSSSPRMIATALCITHWPFIGRDAPADIEKYDTERYMEKQQQQHASSSLSLSSASSFHRYHHHVLFVIRNPMDSIPSYYTRWYGNQNAVRRNHVQPPITEWKKWRDAKISSHLSYWKDMIIRWHDGMGGINHPYASYNQGIGLYVPYELLIDRQQGPILFQSISQYVKDANHTTNNEVWTIADYQCIWDDMIHIEHYQKHKEYIFSYTIEQQNIFHQVFDELIQLYTSRDDVLIQLLQYYRHIIQTKMMIDS